MHMLACLCLHAYAGLLMSACRRWPAYVCMQTLACLCPHSYVGVGMLMYACICWPSYSYACKAVHTLTLACLCLHAFAYICMHALCLHLSADLHASICMAVHCWRTYADVGVFMVARLCWLAYACVHALVYLRMHAYICLFMYAYIHTPACLWLHASVGMLIYARVCLRMHADIGMPMPTSILWHDFVCMAVHCWRACVLYAFIC